MDVGLLLCCQYISVFLLDLIKVFVDVDLCVLLAQLLEGELLVRIVEKRLKNLLRGCPFDYLLSEPCNFEPSFFQYIRPQINVLDWLAKQGTFTGA